MEGRATGPGIEGWADEAEVVVEVVAHCLLNPLTRMKGLRPIDYHIKGPMIQLPCPEALYSGLDRWAVTKNQLDVPEFRRFCRSLITYYADEIEGLASKGFRIRIVGAAGSPSCGVVTTSTGYSGGRIEAQDHHHTLGQGIFFEELMKELKLRSISFEASEACS